MNFVNYNIHRDARISVHAETDFRSKYIYGINHCLQGIMTFLESHRIQPIWCQEIGRLVETRPGIRIFLLF